MNITPDQGSAWSNPRWQAGIKANYMLCNYTFGTYTFEYNFENPGRVILGICLIVLKSHQYNIIIFTELMIVSVSFSFSFSERVFVFVKQQIYFATKKHCLFSVPSSGFAE